MWSGLSEGRFPLHFGRSKLSDGQQTAASRLRSEGALNAQLDLDASDKIFSRKALTRGLDVPLSSQKFGRLETDFGVLNNPLRGNVGLIPRTQKDILASICRV